MNNEPGSSSAEAPHDAADTTTSDAEPALTVDREANGTRTQIEKAARKKLDFLDHIISNVDNVIFAEIAAVYYME